MNCDRGNLLEMFKCFWELLVDNIINLVGMVDFMNFSNIIVEVGSMVLIVDGDLIKEDLVYLKFWDSEVYNFF